MHPFEQIVTMYMFIVQAELERDSKFKLFIDSNSCPEGVCSSYDAHMPQWPLSILSYYLTLGFPF